MLFVEKFFYVTPDGLFEPISKAEWERFLGGGLPILPYAHGYAYVAHLILEDAPREQGRIFDVQFFRYPVSDEGFLAPRDRQAFERAWLRKGGEAVSRALAASEPDGGNTIQLKATLEFRRYEWKPANGQLEDLWSKVA